MPDTDQLSDSGDSFHSFDEDDALSRPAASKRAEQPAQSRQAATPVANDEDVPEKAVVERFSAEEEASMLAESNSIKGLGNQHFGKGSFNEAISTYDRAAASCPNYLDYEIAILRSNIAACHLKLEEWKEAIESATKGIDCLERLEPLPRVQEARRQGEDAANEQSGDSGAPIEEVDDDLAERIENLRKSGRTLDEVRKLQVKLLMRRAKAKMESGGWAALQGADEDYKILMAPIMLPSMSMTDRRSVSETRQKLGPRLNEAREREVAEMMGKLKGFGNSILKPFGLSTENFQFVKDEKTGGYSMNFSQNPDK